jgi:hypothetical protein
MVVIDVFIYTEVQIIFVISCLQCYVWCNNEDDTKMAHHEIKCPEADAITLLY